MFMLVVSSSESSVASIKISVGSSSFSILPKRSFVSFKSAIVFSQFFNLLSFIVWIYGFGLPLYAAQQLRLSLAYKLIYWMLSVLPYIFAARIF